MTRAQPEVGKLLREAAARGLDKLDAGLLLLHVLQRPHHDRAWLLTHDRDPVNEAAAEAFTALCQRRLAGEPVAYLTGRKEFWGLDLAVDARVLTPRPDTETLVEWALDLMTPWTRPRVLDLGTGSGAIALAILSSRPDAQVEAVDASQDALAVAQANARELGLAVTFQSGNWLGEVNGVFDLILSNPPYIAAGDPHLAALAHEPLGALVAGADGLDDIRQIVRQAPDRLESGGWLLLEHGHSQAAAVRDLLADAGFAMPTSRKDLAGIERCSGAQWPGRG
jgi:release factor glutamine methyltransferase